MSARPVTSSRTLSEILSSVGVSSGISTWKVISVSGVAVGGLAATLVWGVNPGEDVVSVCNDCEQETSRLVNKRIERIFQAEDRFWVDFTWVPQDG